MALDPLIAARAEALFASNLSTHGCQAKACPRGNTGQHAAPLVAARAVPQTAATRALNCCYVSGCRNFAPDSPRKSHGATGEPPIEVRPIPCTLREARRDAPRPAACTEDSSSMFTTP